MLRRVYAFQWFSMVAVPKRRKTPPKEPLKATLKKKPSLVPKKRPLWPTVKIEPGVGSDDPSNRSLEGIKTDLDTFRAEVISRASGKDNEIGRLTSQLALESGKSLEDVLSTVKNEICVKAAREFIHVKVEKADEENEEPTSPLLSDQENIPNEQPTTSSATPTTSSSEASIKKNPERPFKCSFCPKAFKRREHLITHENIHRGIKPFKCRYCDHAFTDRNAQACHERVHEGVRPYTCDECGRAFTQRTDFTRHIRIHTGERTHQCRYCEAKFIGSSNLLTHERGHRGERPHKCDECGSSFYKKTDLSRHQRIHTGERPYACQYCPDRFTQPTHRRMHEMAHLKVKPHRCRFCETSFLRIGDLNRHEKRHPEFTESIKRRNTIHLVDKDKLINEPASSAMFRSQ